MLGTSPTMRQLEPFSYFADQASALAGFGGGEASPDPRYCFHTRYEPVRPGRAIYHLTIRGARAREGELTLRVHGYKPGAEADIDLAGGGRLRLRDIDGDRIELPIRFSAAPDAHYALYGYFSEPADLIAEAVDIAIEELGDPADGGRASTRVVASGIAAGYARSNRLCGEQPPSIDRPASQPCTGEQLAAPRFASLWPDIPSLPEDPARRWRMIVPLQLLKSAGLVGPGRRGVILDPPDPSLAEVLRPNGCIVEVTDGATLLGGTQAWTGFDRDDPTDHFALAFETRTAPPGEALSLPERLITRVAAGGMVIAMLAIDPREPWPAFRNRVQGIALRLIGRGHEVAQLCFPPAETLARGEDGLGWFCFFAVR